MGELNNQGELEELAIIILGGIRSLDPHAARQCFDKLLRSSKETMLNGARAVMAHRKPDGSWQHAAQTLFEETVRLLAELEARRRCMVEQDEELVRLRKQLWLPTEVGQHDYHGPTERDPETGKKVPVPDPVHERFHGAVGDVLQGRVMGEARKQMQEALKNAPKEQSRPASLASTDDPRRIGWRV